jgi:hypothetical protein
VSNIIHVDFKLRMAVRTFNADVYSFDMKKYRFQVVAASVTEAYYAFVAEAVLHGVNVIRCIAIYLGLAEQRGTHQVPVEVWQQYHPAASCSLVEY